MPASFTYCNPIYTDAYPSIRDAQITVVEGTYFLTGTLPPYWNGPAPGVSLFRSEDLLHWRAAAVLVDRERLAAGAWYRDRFWAPEIHHTHGRFWLAFSARDEAAGTDFGMALMAADRIEGPYEMLTPDAPLPVGRGIDLSLFTDDDGRTCGFWTDGEWLRAVELDLERAAPLGEPVRCLTKVPGTWEDRVIEGPYCIRRGGVCYLFYSCGARGYEVGYATAPGPLGPWTRASAEPLFGVQNVETCRKMGLAFTGDPTSPLIHAGHNAVFPGPDGRDWTSYLIEERGRPEQLAIDPLNIENGRITTPAPTHTPQTVPLDR